MKDQPQQDPSPSAVDACFAHLRRTIVSGDALPGQHLPPERELALRLGVNRTTLRAALVRLEAAGLVVARQGSGTLVRDFRRAAGLEVLPELLRQTADPAQRLAIYDDLLLMRRQMATAVLARLAAGTSPRARADVASAVAAFGRAMDQSADAGELAQADLAVLGAVLDATQSPVLALCLNPISDVVRHSAELREAMYAEPQANLQAWLGLCDWLAAPDVAVMGLLLAAIDEGDAATLARLPGA